MGIRATTLTALLLALVLLVGAGSATAGKNGGGTKPIVHSVNGDPGGGGSYPYYTGYCRLTGGQFGPGDYYMFPGNERRDKCSSNGAFMYVEFWNGSYWYQTGNFYD